MKFIILTQAVSAVLLSKSGTQEKFSANGEPLHGIVGWDDLNMKPTQEEENGVRSSAATDDDFLAVVFSKYQDENGNMDRPQAYGAAAEVLGSWMHKSSAQMNKIMSFEFDQKFNDLDPNNNKKIAVDEMYGLIRELYKEPEN